MLFGIPVEVVPKLWSKNVFLVHVFIEQITETRSLLRYELTDVAQCEPLVNIQVTTEPDQHDSLAMLWHEVPGIDDLGI
ncbi:hypothetical protein D3C76_973030 [compost metagenome]